MRQICVYAQPTARMSRLIPAINQKLVRPATRNARPSTYSRLVPQSPKSSAPAWNQLTLRGRSLCSSERAGGRDVVCSIGSTQAAGRRPFLLGDDLTARLGGNPSRRKRIWQAEPAEG